MASVSISCQERIKMTKIKWKKRDNRYIPELRGSLVVEKEIIGSGVQFYASYNHLPFFSCYREVLTAKTVEQAKEEALTKFKNAYENLLRQLLPDVEKAREIILAIDGFSVLEEIPRENEFFAAV